MKVPSPAFWLKWHVALLVDGVQNAIDYWRTNTKLVRYLIIGDAAMVLLLLFFVAWLG